MTTPNTFLVNPHLAGDPFFLEGTRPVGVLLFHGLTATCSEVYKLGQGLHRAGFTTSGPLLPGHGTNPVELNRVRWQDWITAAEAAYQDMLKRCQSVFVGGESNGGLVALYLAAEHPEIIGVLAYSPALQLPITFLQRIQLRLIAPFVKGIPKGDLSGNTTWQGYKVNPPKAVLQHMKLQNEVRRRLPQIHQPILIVQGRNDHTIDPRSSEIIYQQIGSKVKELHWMEKSGHCVLLDEEQHEVRRITMNFLFDVMAKKA